MLFCNSVFVTFQLPGTFASSDLRGAIQIYVFILSYWRGDIKLTYYRFTAEAINLLVCNEGQIETGGEFLTEGNTSDNVALLKSAFYVITVHFNSKKAAVSYLE